MFSCRLSVCLELADLEEEVFEEKDFAREARGIIWTLPSLKTSLKKKMLSQLAVDTKRRE